MKKYTLVHDNTGRPVRPGDLVRDFRGDFATVADPVGRPPHKISSTGRVYVYATGGSTRAFFPGVFDLTWRAAS